MNEWVHESTTRVSDPTAPKTNEEVIAILRSLARGEDTYLSKVTAMYGICNIISNKCRRRDLKSALEYAMYLWPKASGSESFPVPHPTLRASVAYDTCDKWDVNTEYGRNRRELCGWIADYFEERLL